MHLRRELTHLKHCCDAENLSSKTETQNLKALLNTEKNLNNELVRKVNGYKRLLGHFTDQISDLVRDIRQLKETLMSETTSFKRCLSRVESDYLEKLACLQRQESRFSELEERTKCLQEVMLKKQIGFLTEDLRVRSEKMSDENAKLDTINKRLRKQIQDQNYEIKVVYFSVY